MSVSRAPSPRLRCAIYTRKSSEEGLEQNFNSLHAQRESCEAYVLSQAGEGWSALTEIYDDGGFSGGTMDRPGLRKLLAAIEAGRVDIVVVYKVDRLTRSLTDFARIVEAFDKANVSFVSVTQAFNTTTSMGRLTLNVLLSFAQFEREVTGERIRDKIAASKAKGMWMGGNLPLGYDAPTGQASRALVVNEPEARTVRLIFERYLETGSVHALERWLDDQAIRSKVWTTKAGRQIGGLRLSRGALFHLLKNRTYVGQTVHREMAYPGEHLGIVDPVVFQQVQALLASQARRHKASQRSVSSMPLRRLIFDADGQAMSPVFTHGKKGQVYRYYVSTVLQRGGRRAGAGGPKRVPAAAIEDLVRRSLALADDGAGLDLVAAVERVEVHSSAIELLLKRKALFPRGGDRTNQLRTLRARLADDHADWDDQDSELVRISIACRVAARGGSARIVTADGSQVTGNPSPDSSLIRGLKMAHRLLAHASGGAVASPEQAMISLVPISPYDRNILPLAFLAPDLQVQILEGRQPAGLTLQPLIRVPLPAAWEDQRRLFAELAQR
ncbi:recombinase family protein [Caulobacter sp.]|uniref:recombinase family protein n=1 Tax=Caulobacter sp. TaxID=78 RepID=UPI003BAB9120